MAALRDLHPAARRTRSQARGELARLRCAHGDRARARPLHAPRGRREHLGRAIGQHHGLRSRGGRRAVRAGTRQDLSPPDVLRHSAGGEDPMSALHPAPARDAASAADEAPALYRYVLRLGDLALVLGQRLSEWVGHAPALEEDLGLANIALDLVGQARLLLAYAGEIEGRGRGEEDIAFLRTHGEYLNPTLVEQPNGDFGETIVRQVLIDAFQLALYERLTSSADERIAEVAAKAVKETRYHLRYSSSWLVRLGDGTPESRARVQSSLQRLWRYTAELFEEDDLDREMTARGIAPRLADVRSAWSACIDGILAEATLERPPDASYSWFGKRGEHGEHLGYILTEMQYLPRAYPGARW